jgi:hypothetical protein|tara:strand:+ start:329 stop:679 length:351 start_codon:yes stop_codon:yes gene_type:complete
MGMLVNVYKTSYGAEPFGDVDCTAGGISSKSNMLCVTNVDGPFEPSEDRPAAVLVMAEPIGGMKILRIEPENAGKKWTCFGGNYAGCSDSRFNEKCRELLGSSWYGAVAIHDRIEG